MQLSSSTRPSGKHCRCCLVALTARGGSSSVSLEFALTIGPISTFKRSSACRSGMLVIPSLR
jgi:hypothetical protein